MSETQRIKRYAGDDWKFSFRSRGTLEDGSPGTPNDLTGIQPGGEIINTVTGESFFINESDALLLDQSNPETKGRFVLKVPKVRTKDIMARNSSNYGTNIEFDAIQTFKLRIFLDLSPNDRQTQGTIIFDCLRV